MTFPQAQLFTKFDFQAFWQVQLSSVSGGPFNGLTSLITFCYDNY